MVSHCSSQTWLKPDHTCTRSHNLPISTPPSCMRQFILMMLLQTLSTRNAPINTATHKEWMVGGLCREIGLFVAFVVCQWDIQEHLNRLKLLCVCISQEIVCYRTRTQTSCFLQEFSLTFSFSFIFSPLHQISNGSWKLMFFYGGNPSFILSICSIVISFYLSVFPLLP